MNGVTLTKLLDQHFVHLGGSENGMIMLNKLLGVLVDLIFCHKEADLTCLLGINFGELHLVKLVG